MKQLLGFYYVCFAYKALEIFTSFIFSFNIFRFRSFKKPKTLRNFEKT